MEHMLAIVGSSVGLVGTVALSVDLLTTKSTDASLAQFRHLQDEVDNAAQELVMRLNSGLATMAKVISGYLATLELEAQVTEDGWESIGPEAADPALAELKDLISIQLPSSGVSSD